MQTAICRSMDCNVIEGVMSTENSHKLKDSQGLCLKVVWTTYLFSWDGKSVQWKFITLKLF